MVPSRPLTTGEQAHLLRSTNQIAESLNHSSHLSEVKMDQTVSHVEPNTLLSDRVIPFTDEGQLESLAVKYQYAADVLKDALRHAEEVQKLQKKLSCYIQQIQLVLNWKNSGNILKMVGSASKTIGGVIVAVAPFHPKLYLAAKVGHRLWKLGSGLKILTAAGRILKDLWQNGCRNSLVEFVHSTTLLTRSLSVLHEVISDMQMQSQAVISGNHLRVPEQLVDILRQFLPADQVDYVAHVVNMVFGSDRYIPVLDLVLVSSDFSGDDSKVLQIMRELESFRFTEFAELGAAKYLGSIGTLLHVSHELLDFLDGFHKVTSCDCQFLQECLTLFCQETSAVSIAVNALTNLDHKPAQKMEVATVSFTKFLCSLAQMLRPVKTI